MDCSAIVLNKLILERNISIWAKLKLSFLDTAYSSVYSAISRYYDKYSAIPSFEELELVVREGPVQKTLATIRLIDEPDVNAEVALAALIDQYTQNQTIEELDKFLDKLPVYDTVEIKESLSSIVLRLDEKTLTTEGVYSQQDLMVFKTKEDISKDRVYLNLNNRFDAVLNGVALEELILIGGPRGSGKSITSSNILINQYEAGNTAVLFTIEMKAEEVNQRNISILANVDHMRLKAGTLTPEELLRVVKVRAKMFVDADDLVKDYLYHKDPIKFEQDLVRQKQLNPTNQMIIIDDRALTVASIDLHMGKIAAKFGDKFTVAIVDYLNQIVHEGSKSQFEWMPQIEISKNLKELARKHKKVVASPYQVDAGGEARFAKGILDAADIALLMKIYDKELGIMGFETTKIRGGPPLEFTSPINWETLRVSPQDVEKPNVEKPVKRVKKDNKADDSSADIPPW